LAGRYGSCKFDVNQTIFRTRHFKTYVRLPENSKSGHGG
jgi:hypothetical protein